MNQGNEIAEEYLSRHEFARRLGISVNTVNNWIARGLIDYWQARSGCRIFIPVGELTKHQKKSLTEIT